MGCITSTFRVKDTLSAEAECRVGVDVTVGALPTAVVGMSVMPVLAAKLKVKPVLTVDMVCTPIDEPEERKPLTATIKTKAMLSGSFGIRSLKVTMRSKAMANVRMSNYTRITPSFKSKEGLGIAFSDKPCVDVSFDSSQKISATFVEVCPIDVKLPCFTTKGWDNELPWLNEKGWNN